MLVLLPKVMTTTWVVDSNAFIHLGSLSPMGLIESLENALKDNGIKLHVTSGVHDEVRNVRFQNGTVGQIYFQQLVIYLLL